MKNIKCSFCDKDSKYLCDAILENSRVESRGCEKHFADALFKQNTALFNERMFWLKESFGAKKFGDIHLICGKTR